MISNDPQTPKFVLTFDGMALSALNIVPDRLLFGRVPEDATTEKTIELTANRPAVVHVRSVTSDCPNLLVTSETIDDGQAYRIHIRLKPPLAASGIKGTIIIKTDHPGYESIQIPVLATVVGQIAVSPEEIVLTNLAQTPVSRYVILSPGKVKDFKVTKVEAPVDSMKVETATVSPGTYRIRLSNVIAGPALVGKSLTISTDLPTMPTITIPFKVDLPTTREATTQPSVVKAGGAS